MQTLVGTLERSRSALAEDLSSLSAENDTLKTQVELIVPLRDNLQVSLLTWHKYMLYVISHAVLQMS